MNTSTVYRLEKQMRETGSVKTRTSQRGRKHALTPEDLQNIDRVVQQEPDITIDEIIDKLGLHVCNETVRKAVIKLGYSYKKNLFIPQSRSVPDVREKRRNWKKHMSEKDINHLVFLDESGVNINMTRHYARAWKNRRAVDKTPLNTPCNTTVLSSIRLNGDCAYTVYQGGTTAERFAEYLKTKLLPTLSEADIIVMDNMRSHHAKVVKQLLDSSKVTYLYLPPYSPDLNPIEKMWSKLKAFLRKEKIRIASELPSAISKGFLTIRPKDCIGWFHSCNYVQ
ncbi:MAG: IS630 family transposase [Blautia obeum]